MDITSVDEVQETLTALQPDAVINMAGNPHRTGRDLRGSSVHTVGHGSECAPRTGDHEGDVTAGPDPGLRRGTQEPFHRVRIRKKCQQRPGIGQRVQAKRRCLMCLVKPALQQRRRRGQEQIRAGKTTCTLSTRTGTTKPWQNVFANQGLDLEQRERAQENRQSVDVFRPARDGPITTFGGQHILGQTRWALSFQFPDFVRA